MSDLISRETVIDTLKQSGIIVDNELGNLIIGEINRIPTAFDVDKVMEQLEEYERYVYDAVSDEDNYVIDTGKAIEIVKGAVKDE